MICDHHALQVGHPANSCPDTCNTIYFCDLCFFRSYFLAVHSPLALRDHIPFLIRALCIGFGFPASTLSFPSTFLVFASPPHLRLGTSRPLSPPDLTLLSPTRLPETQPFDLSKVPFAVFIWFLDVFISPTAFGIDGTDLVTWDAWADTRRT